MLKRKDTPRREPKQIGPGYTLRPRAVAVAVAGPARMVVQVPKQQPVRHEGYRRLVAALPCAWCRIEGMSQAAHADEGKGLQIKSDDRTCYPLCADGPGYLGCHSRIGAGAAMTKQQRRDYEPLAGRDTRAEIQRLGLWPADLAAWPGDDA